MLRSGDRLVQCQYVFSSLLNEQRVRFTASRQDLDGSGGGEQYSESRSCRGRGGYMYRIEARLKMMMRRQIDLET
jgi:hypothetical protein